MVVSLESEGVIMPQIQDKERIKKGLTKKLRNKIKELYQLNVGKTPFQVIFQILSALEQTEILEKLRLQGLDPEQEKSEAFLSILGEEQCRKWRSCLLHELEANLKNAADKMQRKATAKKKDEFRAKVFSQQEKLMEYCLLLGADWEVIQEVLDDTIN